MKSGAILLVQYPFTDKSGSKVRPVLVVSAARFNRGDDIVVVPLSSQHHENLDYALPIPNSEDWFPQTGLRRTSYVKWTKPITLSKSVALRSLGQLPSAALCEVHSKLRGIFDM